MIKVGMIVRYSPDWCEAGERRYLHIVKENRLNPITGKMSRWLIQTLNSGLSIPPCEVVEECMIEPTGFEIGEFVDEGCVD